jgi:hypothetical protein
MPDLFSQLVDEAFGFLVRDHGFSRKDTDEPLQTRAGGTPVARRIEFESKAIRATLCWHRYDELGIDIWVLVDTFWIRPADPRSFDFFRLVRMVDPAALTDAPSFLNVPWEQHALRSRLQLLAQWLRKYGMPLLKSDVSLAENVLISAALRQS